MRSADSNESALQNCSIAPNAEPCAADSNRESKLLSRLERKNVGRALNWPQHHIDHAVYLTPVRFRNNIGQGFLCRGDPARFAHHHTPQIVKR
jgi:hypothetical protein